MKSWQQLKLVLIIRTGPMLLEHMNVFGFIVYRPINGHSGSHKTCQFQPRSSRIIMTKGLQAIMFFQPSKGSFRLFPLNMNEIMANKMFIQKLG